MIILANILHKVELNSDNKLRRFFLKSKYKKELDKMLEEDINMQSTVIIGNSTTFSWNGYMITPRGYKEKYKLSKS